MTLHRQIAGQLRRIADELVGLALNEVDGESYETTIPNPPGPHLDYGRIASTIYSARRRREKIFGGLVFFGEPAWDIILDLVISESRNKRVSIKDAIIASCAPSTTALRWLSVLEEHGVIQRFRDVTDARRTFIELTPLGREKVRAALSSDSFSS
jgi:hypothetical protein